MVLVISNGADGANMRRRLLLLTGIGAKARDVALRLGGQFHHDLRAGARRAPGQGVLEDDNVLDVALEHSEDIAFDALAAVHGAGDHLVVLLLVNENGHLNGVVGSDGDAEVGLGLVLEGEVVDQGAAVGVVGVGDAKAVHPANELEVRWEHWGHALGGGEGADKEGGEEQHQEGGGGGEGNRG